MPQPTPGLILAYMLCPGGACLLSAFGDTPCPIVPAYVNGLPLLSLGPYCFAEAPRESALPAASQRLWARVPLAAPAMQNALPCAPAPDAHRIAGSFLESVVLPDSLRELGSCAFYDCRRLRSLSLGPWAEPYGSDVFLNTFALRRLTIRCAPDAPSGLFRLVNALCSELEVFFAPDGAAVQSAAFYPEYWEDIEETPAHILLHTYSGQGYHYRQCFLADAPLWAEYDAVFPMARAEDPPAFMALLALGRLRWPWALGSQAAAQYREFLSAHAAEAVAALQKQQDTQGLTALLALDVLNTEALACAGGAAAAAGDAEFAALLANALHQKQMNSRPRPRYNFD